MSSASCSCHRRHRWRAAAVGLVTTGLLAGVGGAEARQAPRAVSTDPLVTVAVSPYRVLDTRLGTGTGGPTSPLGPGGTIDVQIAGAGPVPSNAVSVVLNLTATQVTDAGYVTAWPTGEERPTTSVLNLTPGQDIPNMVTVALGDGKLSLYNFAGSVHLLGDIAAYLIPGTGAGTVGPQGPPGPQGPSGVAPQQTMIFSAVNIVTGLGAIFPNANGCAATSTGGTGLIPLDLPVGALLAAVRIGYNDPSAASSQVHQLYRMTAPNSSSPQGVGAATTNAQVGVGTLTLNIGSPAPVAANANYYLTSSLNSSQEVCRVEVDYTMPTDG